MRFFSLIFTFLLICSFFVSANQASISSNLLNPVTLQQAAPIFACPMHPHIQQDHAGTCPICGMALVEKKPNSAANSASVTVSGDMQQALGIRTATATKRKLWRFIETFGQVQYAEDAIHHSHIRAEGWIEHLYVRSLGQKVQAGDKLFSYYAPDLLVAQDDYLQALSVIERDSNTGSSLLQRAETRLRLLGLTDQQIASLKQSKKSLYLITVYAQQDGVVTQLNIRDGMFIKPSDTLIEITNGQHLWVIADVPESQQTWLRLGMAAEVDVPALQRKGIETSVAFIYPAVDGISRTSQARLPIENKQLQLQPNMVLPVRLYGGALPNVLTVPQQAVMLSPTASRVIVQSGQEFSVREVETGHTAQQFVEIRSGLHEGETVVISGQFLLDAEASLSQLPSSTATDAHQHGASGHD
ncbi:efflux RND transporter periplasmic adaptor subunit [Rheinheimera sp. MMS21-TC3]|uniref:efflux RND transporter periplasmic adaptor subunit n=1 Tax=Rheinheimera sp. MMS21-TC3 TaxID=3072790 RepID=UPI0028C480A7|nr:efflux RND transporter periplasmic adaptor subunit [Rheinheimera sp. MMS21-TC3]WNO60375.1 efflux RND transporter periplasmic adaptor subunit [Rheinheimera sp. MMS21-TC3]